MFGWILLAMARVGDAPSDAGLYLLMGAVLGWALLLLAAHFWFQMVLAHELSVVAHAVSSAGDPTSVRADGVCVAERRDGAVDHEFAFANVGASIYAMAGIAATAIFVAVTIATTGAPNGPSVAQCVLLAGFYVSLGVILVDLFADVWPGFTTEARVKRASRYYTQIFEQWRNYGVLAGFLTVLVGAPYAYSQELAPAAVLAFPVWIAGCLCFATFVNQVLHRRGIVATTLPLPVWVNVYSVTNPTWAHFFAVIHLVMALGLLVGISAVGI